MKVSLLRRTVLVVGAAFVMFGISTSFTNATPIYTQWTTPVNLGPIVNSAANETGPAISPDGLSLDFQLRRRRRFGSCDIYVSQRATTTSAWGAPVNLGPPINTSSDDFVPSFSPDGHWMFFASTRPGGFGGPDLYQSYRADIHDDFGWQSPTNLGPGVNTAAAENGNGYSDNGGHPQIYFGSDRLGPVRAIASLYVRQPTTPDGTWVVRRQAR